MPIVELTSWINHYLNSLGINDPSPKGERKQGNTVHYNVVRKKE
ncbi:hypothetical protein [Volucribacter amazonae]|nr:hypothetical protein [Volucribacter amazonae]